MVTRGLPWLPIDSPVQRSFELLQDSLLWEYHEKFVFHQLLYYFIPFWERNKVEMTHTLNWHCRARMSRKITLPKKVIFSLNFGTDE